MLERKIIWREKEREIGLEGERERERDWYIGIQVKKKILEGMRKGDNFKDKGKRKREKMTIFREKKAKERESEKTRIEREKRFKERGKLLMREKKGLERD